MFSLLAGLWNSYFEKPTYKILIVGLDGAGKTVIINLMKEFLKCSKKTWSLENYNQNYSNSWLKFSISGIWYKYNEFLYQDNIRLFIGI